MEGEPFRFLDLPGEIRNAIYEIILCSFEPASPPESYGKRLNKIQTGRVQEVYHGICPAMHSIETTILCTSKEVHREAYDVMVKKNQFMQVRITNLSISELLVASQVPIVTLDRGHADQFQGYMLRIELSAVPDVPDMSDDEDRWDEEDRLDEEQRILDEEQRLLDEELRLLDEEDHLAEEERLVDEEERLDEERVYNPTLQAFPAAHGSYFSFMILGRDCGAFCQMLSEADIYADQFSSKVNIVLFLEPWNLDISEYKARITELYTTKRQEALLEPFRTQLRGFSNVEIDDRVSRELREAVIEEVKKSPWGNPRKILKDMNDAEALEGQFYQDGRVTEASERWVTAISDIRRMRLSKLWRAIVLEGGPDFVDRLTEIYFKLLFNSVQNLMRILKASLENKAVVTTVGDVISSNLNELNSLRYVDECQWIPSEEQIVQMYVTQAQCWRLVGNPNKVADAMDWINWANQLKPGDAEIEMEKSAVKKWWRRVYFEEGLSDSEGSDYYEGSNNFVYIEEPDIDYDEEYY
ncbi:hypothetical protein K505DRAFT_324709 [Melanomma pulvis-pyrius CBS 109.77]|uniref:F-box domain-containing protein n=1 Tax=Melanomma pulvis-pyrius CBS 109.77 TaxID=1314802 RepID=A0A6A6XDJ3_9PLEO|nr:hypothetical protein K505DRAFT_324709 [Melanomma pulvis-pyrius CBS 109.77]